MSRHTSEDQSENTASSLLQSRPQRKAQWRRRALFVVLLLVGAVIIVGTGTVLAVVITPHGSTASSSDTTSSTSSTTKSTANTADSTANTADSASTNTQVPSSCSQGSLPPVYWNILLDLTAQSLHLSVVQVQAQIKGGKSIQNIASEQGILTQQLQNIETNALQAANNKIVAMKCESQADADASIQDYINKGPQYMNNRFTYWFATQENIQ